MKITKCYLSSMTNSIVHLSQFKIEALSQNKWCQDIEQSDMEFGTHFTRAEVVGKYLNTK